VTAVLSMVDAHPRDAKASTATDDGWDRFVPGRFKTLRVAGRMSTPDADAVSEANPRVKTLVAHSEGLAWSGKGFVAGAGRKRKVIGRWRWNRLAVDETFVNQPRRLGVDRESEGGKCVRRADPYGQGLEEPDCGETRLEWTIRPRGSPLKTKNS